MNFKPFSAFGSVTNKQPVRTVADIIAPLQKTLNELGQLISQRSTSITEAQAEIITLENRITADQNEIESAKSIQEKFKNLLS